MICFDVLDDALISVVDELMGLSCPCTQGDWYPTFLRKIAGFNLFGDVAVSSCFTLLKSERFIKPDVSGS